MGRDDIAMTTTDAHTALAQPAPDSSARRDGAVTPALAIEGISHAYGARRALIDVAFNVAPASFTALLGLNGAGKSTLFSLITRLFGIQSGRISIFGHDIGRAPSEALRLMGVVFQPRTLDLDLSVMQNLLYHAALHGIGRRDARSRADEVLARIALADRAGSKVRDLSGGQMRRLEIARALLHRPRLLLLDEPTVGLDVKARADILSHVRQLVTEQGIGVLWATHLFDEINGGDDLVILHQGRMLANGEVARVLSDAGAQDINSAFMRLTGTTNQLGGQVGSLAP
jgi:ABC-2 type transport system ATP-binding protein